jgi:hypothetical protein
MISATRLAGGDPTLIKNEEARPNFLIVGAAKAGTSSLYHWLGQHPEVFMPKIKEPTYFVDHYRFSSWDKYLALFQPGRGYKAIGEASTGYLSSPESPSWIREKLEGVKIIILLRNPVERSLSLYGWMVKAGFEWLPTFERALREEDKRFSDNGFRVKNPHFFWNYMYFRSGLYHAQVERFMDCFGPERVRVYFFEDLVNSPGQVYKDVCDYLSISGAFQPDFSPKNSGKTPRYIKAQAILRRLKKSSDILPVRCRNAVRQQISSLMRMNAERGYKQKLSPGLRESLENAYREDITNLSHLLRKDLSHWVSSVQ